MKSVVLIKLRETTGSQPNSTPTGFVLEEVTSRASVISTILSLKSYKNYLLIFIRLLSKSRSSLLIPVIILLKLIDRQHQKLLD
jgi:hypothetical protein